MGGPLRGRVRGDVEVNDPAPVVGENEQYEKHREAHGGYGEEIDGDELARVGAEERTPPGGGRFTVAHTVFLYR